MHLPGAFSAFQGIDAPKKLVIRPAVPERPFHQFHDEIIAWYDYWMKGIDTGIMDGPAIKIWVRGAEHWRSGEEWPFPETQWRKLYLRAENALSTTPPEKEEAPDTFRHKPVLPIMDAPMWLDPKPESLSFTTAPLEEDMEMVGQAALYLHAAIATEDAHFIIKLKDVSPDGSEFVLTRGWLKASHRELDKEKSKPWQPYHPHTRAVPVKPGEINEYAIEIRPFANLFRKGHRIKLEIWSCDYPADKMDLTLSWPGWSHLSYDKETTYHVHHSPQHASYLVLPLMPAK
ncbi:MAG: CocE/NonD family hydrolase [Chloroflexota bacterium]